MLLIILAFLNTFLALIIITFSTHARLAGTFVAFAFGFGMWCVTYLWGSIFGWENNELSEDVRQKREKLRKKIWKTLFPFNHFPSLLKFELKFPCLFRCKQPLPTSSRRTRTAA